MHPSSFASDLFFFSVFALAGFAVVLPSAVAAAGGRPGLSDDDCSVSDGEGCDDKVAAFDETAGGSADVSLVTAAGVVGKRFSWMGWLG